MFFHSTMTDAELIRAADAGENPHLRLMADRLKTRGDQLREIARLADVDAYTPPTADEIMDRLCRVSDISARD